MQLLWRCGHPCMDLLRMCIFLIVPAPKTWEFPSEALGKLPSRFPCSAADFFFSVPQPSSTRAETVLLILGARPKSLSCYQPGEVMPFGRMLHVLDIHRTWKPYELQVQMCRRVPKVTKKSNAFCSKQKEVWICYVSRYVKAYTKQVLRASCNCQAKRLHEEGSVHAAWCTTNFLDTSATHDSSTQLCKLRSWLKVEGRWNDCCDFTSSKRCDFFFFSDADPQHGNRTLLRRG